MDKIWIQNNTYEKLLIDIHTCHRIQSFIVFRVFAKKYTAYYVENRAFCMFIEMVFVFMVPYASMSIDVRDKLRCFDGSPHIFIFTLLK